MKIEILQNFKKNKNLNSIKKKIEYNEIYCNNDFKRLKDNYFNNIKQHIRKIQYFKIWFLKCEEQFIPLYIHKEIVKKKNYYLKFKKWI